MASVFGSAVKETSLALFHNLKSYQFKSRGAEKKEVKLVRTKSLPTSGSRSVVNEDPSIPFKDDTQILRAPSDSFPPRLFHESTTRVQPTPDPANIGVVNDHTSLLKRERELYTYAFNNIWHGAKSIYDKYPEMVRSPLTASGDTALHVAVSAKSVTFVEELVKLMTPKDLEIPNVDGNTAFCLAAIIGNGGFFKIMIEKNGNLPVVCGHNGLLPVHLAVLTGYHKIVQDLSSENLLQKMDLKDVEQLFFMTINSSMYDVATKLLEKYPKQLVIARYIEEQTALHMLARKTSEELCMLENSAREISSGRNYQLKLLQNLWSHVRELEHKKILELITHPSVVLFDAIKSGNAEVVKWLLYMNRELLTIRDPKNGRNLLHFAVLYRQHSIFKYILKMGTVNLILRAVDKGNRNNVLHFAAQQPKETPSSLRPHILMQKQLMWFMEVEKRVPPELRIMRNKDGKTPKDVFYANQRELSDKVEDAAKGVANYGMVVATLVATVAFAAALTVPGDKTSAAFIVFILTNAVALFSSSASIVSFLSIFTSSSFTEIQSINSRHPSLILGIMLLFISISTMVIAFAAASFLIFDDMYRWVAYLVTSLGVLPILAFRQLRFSLSDGLRDYFFWSQYLYHSAVVGGL